MADTLVQTNGISSVTISFCFATSPEKKLVTVPKLSKVNVGLSSKKADTSVPCAVVKSVMATPKIRGFCAKFVVMRTLSTGTSNRRASSSSNVAELKFSSKGKSNSALTTCWATTTGAVG